MIAYIDGKLTYKDPTYVIIDVNGVGYQIKISLNTFTQLKEGERCKLHTFLHIKEDAHTLYGFSDLAEKNVFLHLISISGVGRHRLNDCFVADGGGNPASHCAGRCAYHSECKRNWG